MISVTTSYPRFPDGDVLARPFFEEGIRHLEDVCVLHEAGHSPVAIASAMKAAEFGVKTIISLGGAMGWQDKVFTKHKPLDDINRLPIFEHHVKAITAYSGTLVSDVRKMDGLSPAKPGGSCDISSEQNPKYPFLSYEQASAAGPGQFRLSSPSSHFGEPDSKGYYNMAQDLLTAAASSVRHNQRLGTYDPRHTLTLLGRHDPFNARIDKPLQVAQLEHV